MKLFQKLFITCAISSFFMIRSASAATITIMDVSSDFWAKDAIIESVQNNYLEVKGDKFYPNEPVTRAEFANAV